MFCNRDGTMLLHNQSVPHLKRACKRAGLRPIHWHVLRHTFASHLAMRGVPLKAIQELLGHATMEMTMRYAHLAPAMKQQAVAVLDLPASQNFGHLMGTGGRRSVTVGNSERFSVGVTGVEPVAFGSGDGSRASAPISKSSPPTVTAQKSGTPCSSGLQGFAAIRDGFATNLLPQPGRRLRVVEAPPEHLLTVREVAERLALHPVTVYRLCAKGEVPHIRISNAIRVTEADLQSFIRFRSAESGQSLSARLKIGSE